MLYGKLKFPSRVLAAIVLSALSMGLQTVNAAPKKKAAQKVKVFVFVLLLLFIQDMIPY